MSNFSIKTLTEVLASCTVVPVTNQVEVHPCLPSFELQQFCQEKGILITAYSPLGPWSPWLLPDDTDLVWWTGRPLPGQAKPIFFTDPDVLSIAERLNASPAQVVISWGVQRGMVVIPKSENVERMKANITVRWSFAYLAAHRDVLRRADSSRTSPRQTWRY